MPPVQPPSSDAQRIAAILTERHAWLIQRVITTLGLTLVEALVHETLAVEAQGGLLTDDQKRRRTPGGVFFKLVKAHTTPAERQAIFPNLAQRKRKKKKPSSAPPATATDADAEVPWTDVPAVVTEMPRTALGAATVKLTLVGRPLQVKELPSYVAVALHGQAPPTLPKGLPTPPAGSAMRFVVFIAHKQWNGVKDSLAQHPEDKLVIQGYPVFDPKTGTTVVLAQQVQSVEQEKAKKAMRSSAAGTA